MTKWIVTNCCIIIVFHLYLIIIYGVGENKDDWRGGDIIKHAAPWQITFSIMQSQKLFPATVKKQKIEIGLRLLLGIIKLQHLQSCTF